MPQKYRYQLTNGKSLVLDGDAQPSDEEVESIAKEQGVELALNDSPPPQASTVAPPSNTTNKPIQNSPAFAGSPQYTPGVTQDAAPEREPDTYWGGFLKGAKDYLGEVTSGIPAGLESLAHPQTTGDFLNLVIPSELPHIATGGLRRMLSSVDDAPKAKPAYNPLPADKDNIAAIAEAINKPIVEHPRPAGKWDQNMDMQAKPATLTDDALYDLARKKQGMGLDAPATELNPFVKKIADAQKPTAEFLGMQPDGKGGEIPLFNIKGGPKSGSTVTLDTLTELGIQTPEIPKNTPKMSGDQMRAAAIAKRSAAMDAKAPGFKGTVADEFPESIAQRRNKRFDELMQKIGNNVATPQEIAESERLYKDITRPTFDPASVNTVADDVPVENPVINDKTAPVNPDTFELPEVEYQDRGTGDWVKPEPSKRRGVGDEITIEEREFINRYGMTDQEFYNMRDSSNNWHESQPIENRRKLKAIEGDKEIIPTQKRGIDSLLSDERGMIGQDINATPPAPEKPFAKFDQESGTLIPTNKATGKQTGPAYMPGKELAPELAAVSKYSRQAQLANETQKKSLWAEVRDANRAALTAFDLSAPGRQGKALMMTKAYWTSFDDMFKSWGSQRAYDNVIESIATMPEFRQPKLPDGSFGKSLAERGGLNIAGKDEVLNSNLAEKLIPGVRASGRAYNAFLSKLRADHFSTMVNEARSMGMNPDKNDKVLRAIGDFINDATGRGSLGKIENPQLNLATGKLEPSIGMKALNEVFFAPKLMASRVNMYKRFLDPRTWLSAEHTDPLIRKQVLKSLLSTVGFGLAVGEMAKLAGAQVSNDPTSSDFRKIKVSENTRIDPFSGFQQYAVGAARLLSGETFNRKNPNRPLDLNSGRYGAPTRASVTGQFFQNKLAPIPSLVWSWMEGRDFDGMPFEAKKALLNRTVPIVMQDLYELSQEDPKLLPLGVLPMMGEGLQTYGR